MTNNRQILYIDPHIRLNQSHETANGFIKVVSSPAYMHRMTIMLLLIGTSLAGCLDNSSDEAQAQDMEGKIIPPNIEVGSSSRTLIIDYNGSGTFMTDLMGKDLANLCDNRDLPVPFHSKWEMMRLRGVKINETHKELLFKFKTNDKFSEIGITGYRVGAYYNHSLIFWTEPMKESTEFTYKLDGTMVDIDQDARWTFFFKRTDPTTENDEEACTAGHQSGSLGIQIYAE